MTDTEVRGTEIGEGEEASGLSDRLDDLSVPGKRVVWFSRMRDLVERVVMAARA